ncbi:leucine-rich repeat domain-containing protein [Candidatus Cytomitobacter indipagum]|uniref:Leucine-rich repeat domain-containing protein n=1 Tax=Candidatus Cytomitobacter indipagum TaxID=2601575 RepID=A0A5C0UFN8_9PROT|nr:leucine-rich repeat domain-containing protein [Candidatus Cytomitobacter indipagum]QEK38072.1 leucine-rich repeat domain-containing protein [Candidatus Cytomitobacter indipagum]
MNINKLLLSAILMQSMVAAPDEAMIDMMKKDIAIYQKVRKENDKDILKSRKNVYSFLWTMNEKRNELDAKGVESQYINKDVEKIIASFLIGINGLFCKIDPSDPNYVENEEYKLSYPFDTLKYSLASYIDVSAFKYVDYNRRYMKKECFNIKYISMHYDKFKERLKNLKKLDLRNTLITTIEPGMFEGLSSLEMLDLSGNQITSIEPGIFEGLSSLKILDLSHNQIIEIKPGIFEELINLTELYLYGNQITLIKSGVFEELSSLTKLDLSRNQIASVESGVFEKLSNLKMLYLSRNNFSSISEKLKELNVLTDFILYKNQITLIAS